MTKLGTTKGRESATAKTLRNGMFVRIVNHAAGTATMSENRVTVKMTVTVLQMTFIDCGRLKKSQVVSPPSTPRMKR